jgi:hypothetical protein
VCKLPVLVENYVGATFCDSFFDLRVVPNALSKTPSRLAGDVGVSESQIFALLDGFLL